MKTKQILFVAATIAAIFFTQQANAKIWRVNNNGYSADFAQLQDANDANNVLDGDTIHLEGSATAYNGATIRKQLIIIGPGYFLSANPATTFNRYPATISTVEFDDKSTGSQLIGIYENSPFGVSISTSNIIIKRCFFEGGGITLSNTIANIKILQNYFSSSSSMISPSPFGFPSDVIFDNNICFGTLIIGSDYTFQECNNNVFNTPTASPALALNAGTFFNNILNNPNATAVINGGDFTNVDYNISASANNQFGNSKHNIIVTDTSTLFIGGTSPDGKYQLKPNSSAKGNGSDSTDRGVFGGGAPQKWYTLSGLAPIPVVYDIISTGVGSTGLPVTIKARTIK